MIHTGDCLEVMRTMPSESVDSVVTDPPAAVSFMGKSWDHNKGGRAQWVAWMTEVMAECYRLLKPGGYAVVWSLPRTCHWTGWAIEDAGFRITDQLAHVFASGFPKGKTQLKPAREDWWLARKPGPLRPLAIDACRIPTKDVLSIGAGKLGYGSGLDGENPGEQHPAGRWPSNLLLSDPELFDTANPYVVGSGAVTTAGAAGKKGSSGFAEGYDGEYDIPYGDTGGYSRFFTYPTYFIVPKADRQDREPFLKDAAVLLHQQRGECDKLPAWESEGQSPAGTTASTSPARAISEATTEPDDSSSDTSSPGNQPTDPSQTDTRSTTSTAISRTTDSITSSSLTRLPTSESTPAASFETGSGGSLAESADDSSLWGPSTGTSLEKDGRSTVAVGSATSAKLSKRNRCALCGKPLPRVGTHPTTKPVDLMRHLIRLVTPSGGRILDPFGGSGTTAIAAELEGFEWTLIEQAPEYVAIAEARLNGVQRGLGLDVA